MERMLSIRWGAMLFLLSLLVSCATVRDAGKGGETFRYIDAMEEWHETTLNPDAPRNNYIKECFALQDGKMAYIGDGRYKSRLGCDISRHDGKVDWQAMREWGIEFVMLRIGYRTYQGGVVTADEKFTENYAGARAQGLDVGVYFFSQAITKEEALEEADSVIKWLEGKELQLPVVFDPESISWDEARTDGIEGSVFNMTTRTFCERVEAAGYSPMVYSNMIWEADMFDMADISQWPVWYADYEEKPQTPYSFVMWQYTAFGEVPGCTAQKTDLDVLLEARE